ncbi:MAG TPA: nucleoside monophosphate kinase [Candidatus Nanoarchaeia archaeon]|nr:nucleoside monophosphate kinase [Candidatus Nanoarchaeia archaeon]
MKLVFLGAPGCGKGTIAQIISKKLKIPHISTGEILRNEVAKKTEIGKKIGKIMAKGNFPPNKYSIAVTEKRISQKDCKNGYILDGFPRNSVQAKALSKFTRVDAVIDLDLDEKKIIDRLSARRVCQKCKRQYNLKTSMRPKKDSLCDVCKIQLVKRSDDDPKIIKHRMVVYHQLTQPIIKYYKKQNKLFKIDASGEPDQIAKRVLKKL